MLQLPLKYKESTFHCSSLSYNAQSYSLIFFDREKVWKIIFPLLFLLSIVSEAGASIYSVSPEANKEMPGLDPNLRSAGKKLWAITKVCGFDILKDFYF